jgi:hypothetical protein
MAISAIRLNVDREIYEVQYDKDEVHGPTVRVKFKNADSDKVSIYTGANDGTFIVTTGKGVVIHDHVTVNGSDGGEEAGEVSLHA